MSEKVDDKAATDPQLPSRRERRAAQKQDVFPAEPTTGELHRAQHYMQQDIDRLIRVIDGDGARDLGLRGDVLQTRGEVGQVRGEVQRLRIDLSEVGEAMAERMSAIDKALAVRVIPRWLLALAAAAAVAVCVAGCAIAYRAVAQEVRAWGARGGEDTSRAEAPL